MTGNDKRRKNSFLDFVLSKWPLVGLEYLLLFLGAGVFLFRRTEWAANLNVVVYITFVVWNLTYGLIWYHWARYRRDEHINVKPKSPDMCARIAESVHNFSSAGVNAVSILLPVNIAVVGFLAEKTPVAGLLEPAFYFTLSLAVALWNLSRLPTMAHREDLNLAYDAWTAFFEMLQLSTLMLGVARLLIELFVLFGN